MTEIDARATIEKAAWQRGFMEGKPLIQFKPGPMAGIGKLPDLSLTLAFENRLGLKGETATSWCRPRRCCRFRPRKSRFGTREGLTPVNVSQ